MMPEQGMCHELFKPKEQSRPNSAASGEGKAKDTTDILNTATYKYVPEVVNDPQVHYWKVPRLGSFMAVPLTYESCMDEEALDVALEDYIEVSKAQKEIDEKRAAHNEQVA